MIDKDVLVGLDLQWAGLGLGPGLHGLDSAHPVQLVAETAQTALFRAIGGIARGVAAGGVVKMCASRPGVVQRLRRNFAPARAAGQRRDGEKRCAGNLAAAVHHDRVVSGWPHEIVAAPGRGPRSGTAAVGDQRVAVGVEFEAELVHMIVSAGALPFPPSVPRFAGAPLAPAASSSSFLLPPST